ncbi:MAG: hypothetical protein KAX37_06235 [Opitutaceae bacterium]|nr:hypothetical protein [Opitutaceae bacterium]
MQTIFLAVLFAAFLFVGILGCMRLGWRIGRKRLQSLGEDSQAGLGTIDGAVFGLMGLLIAFTFTGAASRFDARRSLITEQTNAIGTAWLRLDLLADPEREKARDGFRSYVDTQMEIVRSAGNSEAVQAGLNRLSTIQQEIWATLIQAVRNDKSLPLSQTVLQPTNEMFDLSTTRLMAAQQHPPLAVFVMLSVLVLVSGLLAGYGMAKSERQSTLHQFGFAAIMAFSVYLILDIEYPRLGLVRIDSFDQSIIELRKSMN